MRRNIAKGSLARKGYQPWETKARNKEAIDTVNNYNQRLLEINRCPRESFFCVDMRKTSLRINLGVAENQYELLYGVSLEASLRVTIHHSTGNKLTAPGSNKEVYDAMDWESR